MSAGAVACSSCGYENIVVGCGFCLQCGTEFPVDASIENKAAVQESQVNQMHSAAPVETTAPVASPANETPVATASQANSQCVGLFDSNAPVDGSRQEVSSAPQIPIGGTEAFQSALLAVQENDSFFTAPADPHETPVAMAVEVDDQIDDLQSSVETNAPSFTQPENFIESSENSVQQAESLATPEKTAGTVARARETAEPAQRADEATWPAAESTEPEFEAEEPFVEANQAEPMDETACLAADSTESELDVDEPAVEPIELESEAVEPVADVIQTEPTGKATRPAAESIDSENKTDEPTPEPAEPIATLEPTPEEWGDAAIVDQERTEVDVESTLDDSVETEAEEVDAADQINFSTSLVLELDRLIAAAAKSIDMQVNSQEWDRLVGELEIDGRRQQVHVQRSCTSSGTPLLSFFATCGPASHQHALPLLEWNSALPMCAFAIREIEGSLMFVVQANVPAFSLNQMTIAATLKEIAKRADQVQQRIG